MDSSSYFELRESSDLLKGQILFSYTSLKSGKGYKYPVFLIFNSERIDFYFNGVIKKKQTEDENKVDNYPEFVENHLFSLNLHKGKGNVLKLGDSLRDLFDKKFPVIEDFFIYKGKENRHHHKSHITYAELKEFQNIKKNKDKKQTEDANKVDIHPEFVEMPPFSLNLYKGKENVLKSSTENKEKEDEKNVGEKLSYKKLLLDFLFDVYHSDVFENDPAFTQIKQHLDEIPFIQAIKRKAEFYYQVENNKIGENLITFDSSNSHYIDNLINAQKNWLEILQEEGVHKIINNENKWFDDVETEVKNVFDEQLVRDEFKDNKKNKNHNSTDGNEAKNHDLEKNKKLWKEHKDFLIAQKTYTVKWFIKRNNIIDAWRLFDPLKWTGMILAILILFLIFDIVFLIEDKVYFSLNPDLTIVIWSVLILLIFFFVIVVFQNLFKKSNKVIFKLFPNFFELLIIPFGILILSSAFLVFELTSFGNKYVIFNGLSYKWVGGTFFVLFILGLFLFYSWLFNRKREKKAKNNDENCTEKFKINIKYVILLVILLSPLIYIMFDIGILLKIINTNISLLLIVTFLSAVFLILISYERKNHPNLDRHTSLKKVFSLLLIGLMFSFFANLLVLNYEYKDFLEKYNFIDEIWKSAVNKKENSFKELTFNATRVDSIRKIGNLLEEKESARVDAEKEEYFYLPLEQLKITKIKNGKELYPVLKRINVLGFEIITLPSVLFINTLLTLLLAVLIQVVLNHRKFLEGGKT